MFSVLMTSNETFLVSNIILDKTVTADYRVATLIPQQILFVTQSLLLYFTPKFAMMREDKSNLWSYSTKVGLINAGIIVVICILGILLTPVVFMFYGKDYNTAIPLANLFWISYSSSAIFRLIPLNVLAVTGGERVNAIMSIIGCAIHFVVAWTVLTKVGIMGLPFALISVSLVVGISSWLVLFRMCRKSNE